MSSEALMDLIRRVEDPEIPGMSIVDLGIVRSVSEVDGEVQIAITPTYSGCPALEVMQEEIVSELGKSGYHTVLVSIQHSPPWSSEWLTEAGRKILKASGIAPPEGAPALYQIGSVEKTPAVACPRCDSRSTTLTSEYGATSCKSLWYCEVCAEPFEYFKSF